MSYSFKQLTNAAVGAVATNEAMPLGAVTHQYNCGSGCATRDISTATSGANVITVGGSCDGAGYYKLTYTASVAAGAAGLVTFNLVQNGLTTAPIFTVSETATAVGDFVNITFSYIVRVPYTPCGNNAISLQIINAGVALTSGTSNTIIEKIR